LHANPEDDLNFNTNFVAGVMGVMGSDLSPWSALNGTGCEICIAEVMQSWKVFEDGSVDISVVIEGDVESLPTHSS